MENLDDCQRIVEHIKLSLRVDIDLAGDGESQNLRCTQTVLILAARLGGFDLGARAIGEASATKWGYTSKSAVWRTDETPEKTGNLSRRILQYGPPELDTI